MANLTKQYGGYFFNTLTRQSGGVEINRVKQFWYLGRVLDEKDDDSHAAGRQLVRAARDKWRRFGHVLKSERVSPRVMGYF